MKTESQGRLVNVEEVNEEKVKTESGGRGVKVEQVNEVKAQEEEVKEEETEILNQTRRGRERASNGSELGNSFHHIISRSSV